MFTRFIAAIFQRTLNSVIFGIAIMAAIALYIALGSGWPKLHEYFEIDELQFFNAWPLKILMALLVLNLAAVTWLRIPFTRPRYGVWCIHGGIVVLIGGAALYYHFKVEGTTVLLARDSQPDVTARYFYDNSERCLYARVADEREVLVHPLPSLPRFNAYSPDLHNSDALRKEDLRDIRDFTVVDLSDTGGKQKTLQMALRMNSPLKIDLLGYWPRARTGLHFVADSAADLTVVSLDFPGSQNASRLWLRADDSRIAKTTWGDTEFEHAKTPQDLSKTYAAFGAALHMQRLRITVGKERPLDLRVDLGKTYSLSNSGYQIALEHFYPAWRMSQTGKTVHALLLRVMPPEKAAFHRMVLEGEKTPTDFTLNTAAPGEFGVRQAAPLDTALNIQYSLEETISLIGNAEPIRLMPVNGSLKHTLITTGDGGLLDIAMRPDASSDMEDFSNGAGEIVVESGSGQTHMQVARQDHMREVDDIYPLSASSRAEGPMGTDQVVLVRVSTGSWLRDVALPFSQYPLEPVNIWSGPAIGVPGAAPLQLELGNTPRPLPADLTLEQFDLVHYPGGRDGVADVFRDFKSTILVHDRETGLTRKEIIHLNNPVYFDDGNWLFFQQSWDPNGQHWSVIGVGTRPGTTIMILGCAMIALGLLYAFYAKPIILGRMKKTESQA